MRRRPAGLGHGSAQVAKKKDSVALFEVIQKARRNQANMEVPKWMSGDEAPPSAETPAQAETPSRPPRPVGAAEPLLAIDGDRLRLSLNYMSCAVAVMGLAILLVGAFGLGWWGGSSPEPDAPSARGPSGLLKDRTPLGKHVLGGAKLPGGPGAATQPTGASANRQKGKAYLVIQGLTGTAPEDLEEARRIAAWCGQHGEPATIARYTHPRTRKQRYIVWSLQPFPGGCISVPDEAAVAYARKIEELGKQYFAQHTTYDFRQRMAGGKFNPWFELDR